MIILPRQARDKHRENSKKMPFFVPGIHFQLTEQATLLSAWYQIQPCTCIGRMGMMCGIHRFDCVPPQQDNKTRTTQRSVCLRRTVCFIFFCFLLLCSALCASHLFHDARLVAVREGIGARPSLHSRAAYI